MSILVVSLQCIAHAMGAVGDEATARYHSAIGEYEDVIVDLESTFGPYDSRITQELTGLGLVYQAGGDHEKAISTFESALYLARINEGLYSLSQAAVVEQLIESHIALDDWASTRKRHLYLFELSRRNSGERSALLLPSIARLTNLHLQAFNDDKKHYRHLIHAHELTLLSVHIIENVYGQYDLRLIAFLKELTSYNYYFHIYFGEEIASLGAEYIPAGRLRENLYGKLMHYTRKSIDKGTDTINRIVEVYEHHEDTDPLTKARAQIYIADWEMMTGRGAAAARMYEKIYQDLWSMENIRDDLAVSLAGPTALPSQSLFAGTSTKTAGTPSQYYIRLQFGVEVSGNLKNVEILKSNPEVQALTEEAEKKLLQVKYRPRMAKGRPMATERVVRRLNVEGG